MQGANYFHKSAGEEKLLNKPISKKYHLSENYICKQRWDSYANFSVSVA
jgi:hypothetical protein